MKHIALIAALAIVFGCSEPATEISAKAPQGGSIESSATLSQVQGLVKVGKPMPNFAYKDMDGNSVKLADYKGKVLVVDIFSPS